ncbi:NUDIX domain-containing protein [Candidatus Saccharibacteria bacterium]|nr:NUDIX domain-containing protein [Candidatus Saccharibacteria bacterium]
MPINKTIDWQTIFTGSLFEILQNSKGWEKAVRAPGVRIILDDKKSGKILLSQEFRYELNEHDFRLPGGKVFDTLDEYTAFRDNNADMLVPAAKRVIAETREEVNYDIRAPRFYDRSTLGATVEWDLYVFVTTDFNETSEDLREEDEKDDIASAGWYTYDEVRQMIMEKKMQEDRIAMILLRYLDEKKEAA